MQTEILKVVGMDGEACADKVTSALEAINGVAEVRVSLANENATVRFDEQRASSAQLSAALRGAGYDVAAAPAKSGCCGCCGG